MAWQATGIPPEIEEQLSYAAGQEVLLNFTPHLVPMNRGILITAYASLMKEQMPDGTSVCPSYEKVRALMTNIM